MFQPEVLSLLKRLKEEGIRLKTPNVSDSTGKYIHDLVRDRGYLRVLELGTANGYSTIYLAEAVKALGGHVLTVEMKHAAYLEARKNLTGYRSCVTQIHSDAGEFARSLSRETFDFIFVDAGKKETLNHFKAVWPRLSEAGLLVVDDVVKYRSKMEEFYEFVEKSGIRYEIVMTDPDDGIMLIEKSRNLQVAV